MKASVQNAGDAYLKKVKTYKEACRDMRAALEKREAAESQRNKAGKELRSAIEESMSDVTDTLWLPFGKVIIEVQKGYKSHDGIYVRRLED